MAKRLALCQQSHVPALFTVAPTWLPKRDALTPHCPKKKRGQIGPKKGARSKASNLVSMVCVCANGGPDGAAGSAWAGSGAGRLVELGRLHQWLCQDQKKGGNAPKRGAIENLFGHSPGVCLGLAKRLAVCEQAHVSKKSTVTNVLAACEGFTATAPPTREQSFADGVRQLIFNFGGLMHNLHERVWKTGTHTHMPRVVNDAESDAGWCRMMQEKCTNKFNYALTPPWLPNLSEKLS